MVHNLAFSLRSGKTLQNWDNHMFVFNEESARVVLNVNLH